VIVACVITGVVTFGIWFIYAHILAGAYSADEAPRFTRALHGEPMTRANEVPDSIAIGYWEEAHCSTLIEVTSKLRRYYPIEEPLPAQREHAQRGDS
jgi:hypothetical protein